MIEASERPEPVFRDSFSGRSTAYFANVAERV